MIYKRPLQIPRQRCIRKTQRVTTGLIVTLVLIVGAAFCRASSWRAYVFRAAHFGGVTLTSKLVLAPEVMLAENVAALFIIDVQPLGFWIVRNSIARGPHSTSRFVTVTV